MFQIEKFLELYSQLDSSLKYTVFDALRNRFDDEMIAHAFDVLRRDDHPLNTIILVSVCLHLEKPVQSQRSTPS